MRRKIKFLLTATFFIASSFGNFLFAQAETPSDASSPTPAVKITSRKPILEQISAVENRKKDLVEFRATVEEKVAESDAAYYQKIDEKTVELENLPFKPEELEEDGAPTDEARAARIRRIDSMRGAYERRMVVEGNAIRKSFAEKDSELLAKILSGNRLLSKRQTVSSKDDSLKYSIGKYNSETSSCPITLSVFSGDELLSEQAFDFTSPSGIENLKTIEMDYAIKPKSDEFPSQYEIQFLEIRVKDEKGVVLCRATPTQKSIEKAMTPAYDIRLAAHETEEASDSTKKSSSRATGRASKKQETAEERAQKEKEKTERFNEYVNQPKAKTLRAAIAFYRKGIYGFDLDFNYSIKPNFFIGADIGMMKAPNSLAEGLDSDNLFRVEARIGANMYLNIFKFPPNLYMFACVGPTFSKETKPHCLVGASAGVNIPFSKTFAIFGQFNFKYLIKEGYSMSGEAGVLLRF